jgi:hypothetical protein
VEYFPAYALLFAALAARDTVQQVRFTLSPRMVHWLRWSICLILLGAVGFNWNKALGDLKTEDSADRYRNAANWMGKNSKPGDLVVTTDWDDFPQLFFYNTRNHYVLGLDVNLMNQHDAARYHTWDLVATGQLENPSTYLQRDFGAQLVFTDRHHPAFERQAQADPGLQKVYSDDQANVYQVLSPDGDSPIVVEAEAVYPPVSFTPGIRHRAQDLLEDVGVPCSANRCVLVEGTKEGDFAECLVRVVRGGSYRLQVACIRAPDYGQLDWQVNGVSVGVPFDGYAQRVTADIVQDVGTVTLKAGDNRIRATVRGHSRDSRGFKFGLDAFRLTRVG